MIGTIRRHSTWLWGVIIVVTIFTFVYWGSQSSRFDNRRGFSYGFIDDDPITREEYNQVRNEVFLRYFLSHGNWPERGRNSDFNEERETREVYERLFMIAKLRQYDVHIDSRSVARSVNQLLRDFGRGQPVPFDAFVRQVLAPQHMDGDDLERFVRNELAIQQLISVVSLPGQLIPPDEARQLFEHDHQECLTEAAFFAAADYLERVTNVTPAAVAEFYTNQLALYHVPERVQVSYVAFDFSNYQAQAEQQLTNLAQAVEENFEQMGTNYLRFGQTPEEVKARIREGLIRQQTRADAESAANQFESDLFNIEPEQASNLAALARTNGLPVKTTKPFDEQNGPSEFDGGADFANAAFSLGPDQPFPDQTLTGENAVYVIAFDKKLPDEIPPLDQIRDRVEADYKQNQALLLARQAGRGFVQMATNALARGQTFAQVCSEARVAPVVPPRFSLSTSELPEVEKHAPLNMFKQVTGATPTHELSRFVVTQNGGFAVYVKDRLPVGPAVIKAGLPEFTDLLRRAREQEALNHWFSKEGSVSLRRTPLAQRRQTSSGADSAGP